MEKRKSKEEMETLKNDYLFTVRLENSLAIILALVSGTYFLIHAHYEGILVSMLIYGVVSHWGPSLKSQAAELRLAFKDDPKNYEKVRKYLEEKK